MGTTTTTTTTTPAPRFNLRDQQQQESIFRSRSQQGVPSQISVTTLNQLQQILARNNGEPQQNSFRTQQQIQSGQFNPQQNQFIPQQNPEQFTHTTANTIGAIQSPTEPVYSPTEPTTVYSPTEPTTVYSPTEPTIFPTTAARQ